MRRLCVSTSGFCLLKRLPRLLVGAPLCFMMNAIFDRNSVVPADLAEPAVQQRLKLTNSVIVSSAD